jgi:SPP1 gp7 family putative phage head morphogenesis protein
MTWQRAMDADARLAARNAVKIRAALKQSINSKTMFEAYLATQPQSTGNIAQDRARARAWAIINVRVNMETLKMVLLRVWATGYLLGDLAAQELIAEAERRESKSADIVKADIEVAIDWATWEPGDQISALILKPTRAFRRLLEAQGITLKELTNTELKDIGNAIGEAISLGLSPKQAAKLISQTVASPMRALMIAITESNRAVSAATVARYQDAGLAEMEWTTFDPCPICAQNDGQTVGIGAPFPSGHTQPPAHPNCRCALLPVIPDFDAPNYTGGQVLQLASMPSSKHDSVRVRHINPYASQIEQVD